MTSVSTMILRAAALGVAMSCASAAQDVRPYRPAFDVIHYDLTIDLPDTGSVIHGRAVLSVARKAGADTLVLDLLDLGVNTVTVDGRSVAFVRRPDVILVPLPVKRGVEASYEVAVDYAGTVTDGLIVRTDSAGDGPTSETTFRIAHATGSPASTIPVTRQPSRGACARRRARRSWPTADWLERAS
jgi:hypothetical protein